MYTIQKPLITIMPARWFRKETRSKKRGADIKNITQNKSKSIIKKNITLQNPPKNKNIQPKKPHKQFEED